MNFFKKLTYFEKAKNYIYIFIIFFLMNNVMVIGSENKLNFIEKNNKVNQFEKVYFQNSISFNEYDNLESQLKTFFGFYSYRSENSFYPDLSIINDSESLREIYRYKLNDMGVSDNIYNVYR